MGPPESTSQTASRSVQPFFPHSAVFPQLAAEGSYILQWAATFPGLTPLSIRPNGILIGSAVFAEFTIVTDRPTDRQITLLRVQQQAASK